METENQIIIECPKCKKKNAVNISEPIECYNCKTVITQKKVNRPIITVVAALVIGLTGGHFADDMFEQNRYPIKIEHQILQNCISGDKLISRYVYQSKASICLKALENTQKQVSFSEFEEDKNKFLKIFKEEIENSY